MTEFILCADFSMFQDQHEFNPTFLLAGYSFVQLSNWSSPEMKVQTIHNELGLKFPQAGVEITLPTPVTRVNFRVANGNQPTQVQCFDASGNITEDKNIHSTSSSFVDFQIAASTISVLKITGGNDETRISRICIAVCVT